METLFKWLLENTSLIIPYILGSGGILAYFFERRKRNIDLKQQDASALQTMQDAYDKFTQDSLKRYEDLKKDQEDLKTKIQTLEEDLGKTLEVLKIKDSELVDLKREYKDLYEKYQDCTKEVEI